MLFKEMYSVHFESVSSPFHVLVTSLKEHETQLITISQHLRVDRCNLWALYNQDLILFNWPYAKDSLNSQYIKKCIHSMLLHSSYFRPMYFNPVCCHVQSIYGLNNKFYFPYMEGI